MTYLDSRFVFLIPLKARASCSDWTGVLARLNETLGSLLNQADGRFRVIVACQDEPATPFAQDARIGWLPIEREPPGAGDPYGGNHDKRHKLFRMAGYLKRNGADDFYGMLLDADDLVHRDLVQTALKEDNHAGHIMHTGYFYDMPTGRMSLLKGAGNRFYTVCGSSCAAYLTAADLPAVEEEGEASFFGRVTTQAQAQNAALAAGRAMAVLDFPACVYRMNHEESQQFQKKGLRRHRGEMLEKDEAAEILERDFGWPEGAARMRETGEFATNEADEKWNALSKEERAERRQTQQEKRAQRRKKRGIDAPR